MANDNTEFNEIVKKCKILLLDIEGTTTSINFVKEKLFPYAADNVKAFLDAEWETDDVKQAVAALRALAVEDKANSVEAAVAIPGEDATKEEQIEGLVDNVKWLISLDRKVAALKNIQALIWKQGYDKGDIKGHVFEDVLPAMEQWRAVDGQKIYIYSSGSADAQKLLFGQSTAGDLLPQIDGHFDLATGAKVEAASYKAIAEKIKSKPEEILFLTDILKEAAAARASGLQVALVSREGNASLPAEATYPVLHSFAQLTVTNKRKTDPQDEVPAKVPKTDIGESPKPTTEESISSDTKDDKETSEKMEVEEQVNETNEQINSKSEKDNVVKKLKETQVKSNVMEVTDKKTASDAVPVVIEEGKVEVKEEGTDKAEIKTEGTDKAKMKEERTDEIEMKEEDNDKPEIKEKVTESMDTETISESTEEKSTSKAPATEESILSVITQIEDITDDKESLSEVAEIIEDLEPVVEEPETADDDEELQSAGEVLEKECDEILSKVKPLISTIVEDVMEDTNDIMENILDSEIEREENTALNNVEKLVEVSEGKQNPEQVESGEVKSDNNEESKKETEVVNESKLDVIPEESESIAAKELVLNGTSEPNKKGGTEATENGDSKMDTEKNDVAMKINEPGPSNKDENADKNRKDAQTQHDNISKTDKSKDQKSVETQTIPASDVALTEGCTCEGVKDVTDANKENISENEAGETESSNQKSVGTELVEQKSVDAESSSVSASVSGDVTMDEKETKVNGKATNGNVKELNGNASKEEVSSRLMENGKEPVNGSNGEESNNAEKGEGDTKMDTEVSEIKVKTISTEEPCTDTIEQPTEA